MGWFTKKEEKSNEETCDTTCIQEASKRLDDMDQKLNKMDEKLDDILKKEACKLSTQIN